MSNETHTVRRRATGIALLGASAIMLAATGETIWHANAAASKGRWAAPTVGVATAMMANEAAGVAEVNNAPVVARASATAEPAPVSNERPETSANGTAGDALFRAAGSAGNDSEVQDPPIPGEVFKPFVLVRIPYDQSAYPNGGEVLGVSNHGLQQKAIAVGYVMDEVVDNNVASRPFMFTAATNTVTMLDMGGGAYAFGRATSISPDGEDIGGWAYHSPSSEYRAVVWKASTGYTIDASLSPATDSLWHAVNNDGVPAGAYDVSGHFESVVGDQTPGFPFSGQQGEAKGINASEAVAGWYINSSNKSHAYTWHSTGGNVDLHPSFSPYQNRESGANCINGTSNIGGWLTNQYGSHIATHWKPVSPPGVVYQTTILGDGDASSYEVVAINSNTEMLINRVDAVPGIVLWINNSEVNDAVVIDTPVGPDSPPQLILKPNPDDHMYNGHCLNDDMWIGGSYLVHGAGLPRPCLAIPYDIDNNGVPDFREVVESKGLADYTLDMHGFPWLIDVGENILTNNIGGMRVGLNSPGYADAINEQQIANTQVVRLHLGLHRPDFQNAGAEEFYVNGILDGSGQSQCGAFQQGLNLWAQQIDPQTGREIVLTLRSNLDATDPGHDYLPTAPNVVNQGITKAEVLANLHRFSYGFSRCIDWVQLGNEAFSSSTGTFAGDGGYKIWAEELGDCWPGANPREFENIPLSTCFGPALAAVQNWRYEQMWAILEGSALAGRPLRIIGPGITSAAVLNGYDQGTGDKRWNEIEQTMKWCLDYQAWFDVHDRYLNVQEAENILDKLFTSGPNHQEWSWRGLHVVCLELAPKLDTHGDWWEGGNDALFPIFLGIPQCDAGIGFWDTYINGWKSAQFNNDFGVDTVISRLRIGQGEFTVACYGSTLQLPAPDPLYDLPALRAQNVCPENFQNNPEQFSPLRMIYENAALPHQISPQRFDPHPNACTACGGN